MDTITAILEADPDGTLHVPLPAELRRGKVQIVATLQAADAKRTGDPTAAPDTVARRAAALMGLRALGGLSDLISDPVAWQHEMRQDRPLPGRE